MTFNRLRQALKRSASGATSFVALYDTALAEPPKELFGGIEGLTAVQPVRKQDGTLRFIAYWSSTAAADLSAPVLKLRLGADPSMAGVAGEPITAPAGFLDKAKNKAVPILLTTVAVLAALEALSNRYESLIAAPQFTARFNAPTYYVDEGESVSAELTVENALTDVQLTKINVRPTLGPGEQGAPGGKIKMLELQDVALPGTKNRSYHMTLEDLTPGERLLSADIHAKAGTFRDEEKSSAVARVIVWPRTPRASITLKQVRQDRADFSWYLTVGKIPAESSVTCDLRLLGSFDVPRNNYWRPLGKISVADWDAEKEGAVLQVTWSSVEARSVHQAQFSLLGDANTDWNQVANTKPMCSVVSH